ncbi:MAG: BamA/TamA family outer membrane protein [Bacteroidales bacterium]|nr:BamA/TamA family outer membrane protein [Bacteroidales bacterium]
MIILSSCNPTKYVRDDESLLSKNNVVVRKGAIEKNEVERYIRQKPNKRIFGARFHLWLYNISNLEKNNWFNRWLRQIGEEPVIFDEYQMERSTEQIKSYISSKGYFDSNVSEEVFVHKKEADVNYNIDLKEPYTIRKIIYDFEDPVLYNLFVFDSINCLLKSGNRYDESEIMSESSRFARFVKDEGFYSFSDENIFFRVDSTVGNIKVDLYYEVHNRSVVDSTGRLAQVPHVPYKVKSIYVFPDFVPKDVIEKGSAYANDFDTTLYKGVYFVTANKGKPQVKYDLILQSLYLQPGMLYNVTNTELTEKGLMGMKVYRLVNIFFNEASKTPDSNGVLDLNCNIQLTSANQQSYKVELEGTNTAGDLGGALGFSFQHNNLFRGAERFNISVKAAYEVMTQQESMRHTQEYGIEAGLKIPRFIMPFVDVENRNKHTNTTTTISGAYNYQNMPMYSRTMSNATFGYEWSSNEFSTFSLIPLQYNQIHMISIDSAFRQKIATSSYMAYSYEDVMILGGSFSYVFTNQLIKKRNDYWFMRINFEPAGNLLGMLRHPFNLKGEDGRYTLFNQPFAQYVKADIDLRYNKKYNDFSTMAYRFFVGAGIPYGNSQAMPFEKQYFGGGANGLRAWQVRTLGPGSYVADKSEFLNQTGDIKIEANAEYRFKLFWKLEGALFVDAGNIWLYNSDEAQPGSQFKFKDFIDEIAVGTGTGLRFDLKFVLIRADVGIKMRDPAITENSKWIILNRKLRMKDDCSLVIAIGYPF